MPRVIIQSVPRSPKFQRFVNRLVQELRNPGPDPQPLIMEEEVAATRSRHVRVIWDQWKKIVDEQRSDVILEAYQQAEGPSYAEQITIALGLTSEEALALGLLPWKVEPILSGNNRPSDAEYGRALLAEELAHACRDLPGRYRRIFIRSENFFLFDESRKSPL